MIDGIVTAIVRPPRAKYSSLDLGPTRIRHRGIEYKREDFNITNVRGLKLSGSVWSLMNPKQGNPESCILYLHPNSGSRVDVVRTRIMSIAANAKCTVCGFDFAGCGESEGDCVTLGVREKEDVCTVMSYLFSRGCTKFVLWGRSMGAATAAMFYGAYKELLVGTVVALILDSPFTSMQGLATEYTTSRVAVPGVLLSPAVHYLRHNILARYGFDILHISPVAASARINIPTIVLSGSEDKIVPPALSEELYDALGGPKMRIFFRGGHNTHRPAAIYEAIRVVLVGALRGLSSNEVLRMSAAVLKNEVIGVRNSADTPTVSSGGPIPSGRAHSTVGAPTITSLVGQSSIQRAELRAEETECALNELLKNKTVSSITTGDVSKSIGKGAGPDGPSPKGIEPRQPNGSSGGDNVLYGKLGCPDLSLEHNDSLKTLADSEDRRSGEHSAAPPSLSAAATADIGCSSGRKKPLHETANESSWSSVKSSRPDRRTSPSNGPKPTSSGANGVAQRLSDAKASVHSISLDFGPQIGLSGSAVKDAALVRSDSTWMESFGLLLWGADVPAGSGQVPSRVSGGVYDKAPAGSMGYMLHHMSGDICPPEAAAWEDMLLARASAEIIDAVVDQVITLVVGLVEAAVDTDYQQNSSKMGLFGGIIPEDTPAEEKSLMLSMIIAQLTSEMGLVSVDGRETIDWGVLVTSPASTLLKIINGKRTRSGNGSGALSDNDSGGNTEPNQRIQLVSDEKAFGTNAEQDGRVGLTSSVVSKHTPSNE